MGQPAQVHVPGLDVVQQTAWRRDHNVDAARQRLDLVSMAYAAEYHRLKQFQMAGVAFHLIADLDRQLARRGEDQRAWLASPLNLFGGQRVEDGQGESGGLAGAGLGDAQHVAPFHQRRNGLRLDRGRRFIVARFQRAQDGLSEAERLERQVSQRKVLRRLRAALAFAGAVRPRRRAQPGRTMVDWVASPGHLKAIQLRNERLRGGGVWASHAPHRAISQQF